jgi:hypothetical protein
MLLDLGFTSEQIAIATAYEDLYQGLMRTALRNRKSNEIVHAYVIDRFQAWFLEEMFPGAQLIKLEAKIAEKPKAMSQGERNRRYRAKKKMGRTLGEGQHPKENDPHSDEVPQDDYDSEYNYKEKRNHFGANAGASPRPAEPLKMLLALTENPKVYYANEFEVLEDVTIAGFVDAFRTISRNPIAKKEGESKLFLLTQLDLEKDGGMGVRRQANFIRAFALIIDVDDGLLAPEEFEEILRSGKKCAYVICNSFSRSPDKPSRYRIVIFFSRPAESVAEYKAAFRHIRKRVEAAGCKVLVGGKETPTDGSKWVRFDAQCSSGVQLWWLPCTNRAYPEWAFFRTHEADDRGVKRYGLDPGRLLAEELEATRAQRLSEKMKAQRAKGAGTKSTRPGGKIRPEYFEKAKKVYGSMGSDRRTAVLGAANMIIYGGRYPVDNLENMLIDIFGWKDPILEYIAGAVKKIRDELASAA